MKEVVKSKIYHPSEGGSSSGAVGGGGGDTDFNGNRPITRQTPGIEGVTPGGTTIKTMLENLLFPALAPLCSLSVNNPIREIGSSTAFTLSWNVTKRTNPITAINVDASAQTPTGNNQSGTVNGLFASSTGNYLKSMTVSDGTLSTSASVGISFLPRMFFGSLNKNTGITDSDILSISSNELRSNRLKSFTNFGGGGNYLVFAFPSSFGTPAFVVNGLANTAFTKVRSNSPFVNAFGATINYDVWVSDNLYNSPLNSLEIN